VALGHGSYYTAADLGTENAQTQQWRELLDLLRRLFHARAWYIRHHLSSTLYVSRTLTGIN
jgi:hypothetical protein